jgi:hypothetical protein
VSAVLVVQESFASADTDTQQRDSLLNVYWSSSDDLRPELDWQRRTYALWFRRRKDVGDSAQLGSNLELNSMV